ncbi:MAG: hypothetical protein IAF38_04415 [Bacteroidia bacterium]|nr:hypothetical protein [Bacteroidia bacterium]
MAIKKQLLRYLPEPKFMKINKTLLSLFFVAVFCCAANAQYKIGQWVDYMPYNSAVSVTHGGGKIYAATGTGVFSLNAGDNSLEKMNKIYGLNDVEATIVRYNSYNNTLIIIYSNSNIDVVKNGTVTNFSDIKSKNITTSKTVNNVSFYHEFAYICCDFGLVVFDTERLEFKDTYIIGNLGAYLAVYDAASDGTIIFAATKKGLKQANAASNLSNYQNWSLVSGLPASVQSKAFNSVVKFNNHFIANYSAVLESATAMQDTTYLFDGSNWSLFPKQFVNPNQSPNVPPYQSYVVKRILADESNQKLIITDQWGLGEFIYSGGTYTNSANFGSNIVFYDQNNNYMWPNIAEGVYTPELGTGTYCLATTALGLIKTDGTTNHRLLIDGPDKNYVSQMAICEDKMVVAPVFLTEIWYNQFKSNGVFINNAGSWNNYNKAPLNSVIDINCVAYLNKNPNHYFAGSWGDGLCEFRNDTLHAIWSNNNSSLQPATTTTSSVRINGLAADTLGNLWVSNAFTTKLLSVRKPDETWVNFNFSGPPISNQSMAGKVIVDKNNQKWILIPSVGFIVYDDGGTYAPPTASNHKKITTVSGAGGLPSSSVFSICEDKEGDIWIGTDKGPAVFYSPESIISNASGWDCQQIIIDNNGIAKILLETETVWDIVVDGENRKWIATKTGVYCLSPDGQTQIHHFTTANSPLFSDYVIDLEYNGKTGDIFIGTLQGIQSYRTEVIDAFDEFTDVYSYPNPVRPGYEGPIVIKGMVSDAVIKITDITGALVYETKSKGGQAIWYGKNFRGEKVASGVYVVFCASGDGEQKKLTKILVVN